MDSLEITDKSPFPFPLPPSPSPFPFPLPLPPSFSVLYLPCSIFQFKPSENYQNMQTNKKKAAIFDFFFDGKKSTYGVTEILSRTCQGPVNMPPTEHQYSHPQYNHHYHVLILSLSFAPILAAGCGWVVIFLLHIYCNTRVMEAHLTLTNSPFFPPPKFTWIHIF